MTSGFGKVILLGEHAVVYGHPAIAGALSLQVTATVRPAATTRLVVPQWGIDLTIETSEPEQEAENRPESRLTRAIRALVAAAPPPNSPLAHGVEINASSTLPARTGLGSSAALSVAITRALAIARKEQLSLDDIEARANLGENCFHDRPSGVDVAMATRGGLGLFCAGQLTLLPAPPIRVVIALTGEVRETGNWVAHVAAARQTQPAKTNAALHRLGQLAHCGATAIADTDTISLAAMFDEAQAILRKLGVSSPGIEDTVAIAKRAGARGAKLTGAGGGGAVIAIAPGQEQAVTKQWTQAGYRAFVAEVGVTQPSSTPMVTATPTTTVNIDDTPPGSR